MERLRGSAVGAAWLLAALAVIATGCGGAESPADGGRDDATGAEAGADGGALDAPADAAREAATDGAADVHADAPTDDAPAASRVVQITAAAATSCAVLSDGTARCWGANESYQVGDGTLTMRTRPVAVVGLAGIARIAPVGATTCAITRDGQPYCWGANGQGTVGDGTTVSVRMAPTPVDRSHNGGVDGTSPFVEIRAGGQHVCGVVAAGDMLCWGSNSSGEIVPGTPTAAPVRMPFPFGAVPNMDAFATGSRSTCVIHRPDLGECWGGPFGSSVAIDGTSDALTQIAAGGGRACARRASGAVACGNGGGVWTAVPALSGATRVVVGDLGQVCGLLPGGELRCPAVLGAPMVTAPALTGIRELAIGAAHFCALMVDGAVLCWGDNSMGQLGDGTLTARAVPTPVAW